MKNSFCFCACMCAFLVVGCSTSGSLDVATPQVIVPVEHQEQNPTLASDSQNEFKLQFRCNNADEMTQVKLLLSELSGKGSLVVLDYTKQDSRTGIYRIIWKGRYGHDVNPNDFYVANEIESAADEFGLKLEADRWGSGKIVLKMK